MSLLAAVQVGGISSGHAASLEPQVMRDWTVRCHDSRYCIAETPGKSASGEKMLFKLERSGKPDAKIFVTTAPDGPELSLNSHVKVEIVGHDYSFWGDVSKVYDGNQMAFVESPQNRSIQKLRSGRFATITVKFGDGKPTIAYDVSLQGVSSVLAAMDVVQGRLDREDAAVVTGGEDKSLTSHYDLAAASAPEKPGPDEKSYITKDPEEDIEYPTDSPADPPAGDGSEEESGLGETTIVYDIKQLPDEVQMPGYRMLDCDFPAAVEAFGAQTINLEPGVFLYFVACQNADVNVPFYAALEVAGSVETLEFQEPASATGQRISLITNPSWDKQRSVLTSYQYFSPEQDCGQYEVHMFDPVSNLFNLSEYRRKETCDGVQTSPKDYPMEWNGEGD